MARAVEDIRKDYTGTLSGYLVQADEEARLHAHELGRMALIGGIGVLDIVTLHHEALASLGAAGSLPSGMTSAWRPGTSRGAASCTSARPSRA